MFQWFWQKVNNGQKWQVGELKIKKKTLRKFHQDIGSK